jgi:hypothetical protein
VARLALGVAFGVVVGLVVVSAIAVCYAQTEEPPQVVIDAASDAGVDPLDLEGAVNTTGLEAREYLYQVGELERPYVPPPVPVRAAAAGGPFGLSPYLARVAACESIHFRTDVVYGPTRGRAGEIGLFQLKPGGMLPVFYAWGYTNPWSPWQQAAFATKAFALGYGGRWSCA